MVYMYSNFQLQNAVMERLVLTVVLSAIVQISTIVIILMAPVLIVLVQLDGVGATVV